MAGGQSVSKAVSIPLVAQNTRDVWHETGINTVGYCPLCVYLLSTWCNRTWPNLPGLPPPYLHIASAIRLRRTQWGEWYMQWSGGSLGGPQRLKVHEPVDFWTTSISLCYHNWYTGLLWLLMTIQAGFRSISEAVNYSHIFYAVWIYIMTCNLNPRFTPYTRFRKCRICKQTVHQAGSHYCQGMSWQLALPSIGSSGLTWLGHHKGWGVGLWKTNCCLGLLCSAAAYQTNHSLCDKSTKIGTKIHYYTMNIFRYWGIWNCTCVSHGGRSPKWLPSNDECSTIMSFKAGISSEYCTRILITKFLW